MFFFDINQCKFWFLPIFSVYFTVFLQFVIFLYTTILVSTCTLGGKRHYVNVFVKAFFSTLHQKVFKSPFILMLY